MEITTIIDRLRQLNQINVQTNWLTTSEDIDLNSINFDSLELTEANDQGYLTWEAGHKVKWFVQKLLIPEHLQGYPLGGMILRLSLAWWAEDAQIFVNDQLVQAGDLFDSSARILLTSSVQAGQEIIVALRLVSPGHDIGGLMRSLLIYERDSHIDPGFVADELTILYNYLTAFDSNNLTYLEDSLNQIDWEIVGDDHKFDSCLLKIRQSLEPLGNKIKQRNFNILGHSHLDMAWLWTVAETWQVAERTFNSVINLQKDFSYLTFGHTTSVLYDWIEKHRPQLFEQIKTSYKAGTWEVLGGMWVEPEVNLVSGESLVRQLLYGQNYIKEKFGNITKIAWLTDSFGFSWQLPQLFKQSGIDYFVTGKLHWNNSFKFPHGVFWWQSPDGTKLLTLMSPPNVAGIMDTNPVTMTNYSVQWEQQTGLKEIFWIPGIGDHGGGPTRDMLKVSQRWQQSPFFPKIEFVTAKNYLDKVANKIDQNLDVPVWNDELYLDLHRGCYTSHADQKYFNRRSEELLYKAELWSSLATIIQGKSENNNQQEKIEYAWKKVLFNQFHDILPGTSITDVFIEANQDWQEVEKIGTEILENALQSIISHISFPSSPQINSQPIVIFNHLNWSRSEVVEIPITDNNVQVYDLEGNQLISQISKDNKLLFLAQNIPAIGYRVYWLSNQLNYSHNQTLSTDNQYLLQNEYLTVKINSQTGNIDSIYDKVNQREILKGIGNELQSFRDQGQYWDAWNIDPEYHKYPLPDTELKSIETVETGPIRWRIRVIKQLGKSEFCQDYILQINSPIVTIKNQVNWQEKYILVKASFPLNLTGDYTTYEIPFAAIERTNFPQTPAEAAKWEVPALRWADLTDNSGDYGVSLLNDCKYGYDSQSDRLRLTLLKSPRWPDPTCDQGIHYFTYGIYPHQGNWKEAKTVQRGYELNLPLQVVFPNKKPSPMTQLPPVAKFLNISDDNLILSAFKPSENQANCWILRCYESQGKSTKLCLESDLNLQVTHPVNILEESIPKFAQVEPWKIASFSVNIVK